MEGFDGPPARRSVGAPLRANPMLLFLTNLTEASEGGFNPLELTQLGNALWTWVIFLLALPIIWKVVMGPITNFGSIEVNDVVLDTSNAAFLIDGIPGAQTQLQLGQVVRVIGSTENGEILAVFVAYQENVIGPIDTLDTTAGTVTVLGQQVRTDANTVFSLTSGTSFIDLSVGDPVEISGFKDDTGEILARYVGSNTTVFEASASITAVDANALTFELGGLTVDYSQATVIMLPNGMPEVGQIVEVEGATIGANGELVAQQILTLAADPGIFSVIDTDPTNPDLTGIGAPASAGINANVSGLITNTNLPNTITVGDVQITLTAMTVIVGGTVNDLSQDRLIQVEGQVTNLGEIEANVVTIF